jgi:dienelactone hydrolase
MASAVTFALLSLSLAPVSGHLRGNAPSATDDDHNQSALLGGLPHIPSCSNIPSPTDCSAAENVKIGGQASMIFNSAMDKIVLLLHGWDLTCVNKAENYCDLAQAISELGYQVVLPRGNSGPTTTGQILQEKDWALKTAKAVRDHFGDRSIAVVGHSLGGAGAIQVAEDRENAPKFSAYVSMHPATIIAPQNLYKARGPILITMGTSDKQYPPAVTEQGCQDAYKAAHGPKAYVDVKGNQHFDPASKSKHFGGYEFTAMKTWLHCFLQDGQTDCPSFHSDVCIAGSSSVADCLSDSTV